MLNLNLNWVSETIKTIKDWWPVVKSNFQQIQNNYNSHISGTSDKHLAEHITYSGVVSGASNVKQGIDNIKNSYNGHVNGESDKHAAEHITFSSNRPTLPDSDVKGAIETVDSRIEQIIQGQSIDPNKDVEVLASRTSSIYGEFPTLTERLDNADTIINDINAKIDAPDYSAPQEVTDSVITLPYDVVEGQFSDIVLKGNIRINLIKSSNMDKDSNGDGIVDDFTKITEEGITATYTFDTTEKAQKIEITASTTVKGAYVRQTHIKVSAGEVISGSAYVKTSGNIRARVIFVFYGQDGNTIVTIASGSLIQSPNGYSIVKYENVTVPANVYYVSLTLYINPINIGDTGTAWFKNALFEKTASVGDYISSGIKSTESVRVKSVGKNLFNPDLWEQGSISSDGTYLYSANIVRTKFIPIEANKRYTFSGKTYSFHSINWFDSNGNFISRTTSSSLPIQDALSPSNARFAKLLVQNSVAYTPEMAKADNYQFEEGTTATTYEPYTETVAYIGGELCSLPNGVKDEYSVITGEGTQRTGKKVLQASDITSINVALTNVDIAALPITNLPGCVPITTAYIDNSKFIVDGKSPCPGSPDDISNIGKWYTNTNGNIYFIVAKGTTLEQARTSLAGTTVIYQLATPIVTQNPAQSLVAYPNGHVIIEPVVRITKPYNAGITVDKPIQALESITKVDDGVRTPVDLSKATIAGDKLSLTITGAINNETYEIIYQYPSELTTLPTIRYSYPQNVAAAIAGNTKATTANGKAINDFIAYQNAVNLQFDLRITALEP